MHTCPTLINMALMHMGVDLKVLAGSFAFHNLCECYESTFLLCFANNWPRLLYVYSRQQGA